ncbi:ankyrin repeat and SAM domain-containing protein 1A-like isoform X5 [Vespula maculifrons]|uniref:Ankyrin repeat and SAM domain-containing protein 1A-like isoform X5 n=1 Tax=Vespula maculifrons TaxID=7453 RepID=A0ABD2CGL3_VESMC
MSNNCDQKLIHYSFAFRSNLVTVRRQSEGHGCFFRDRNEPSIELRYEDTIGDNTVSSTCLISNFCMYILEGYHHVLFNYLQSYVHTWSLENTRRSRNHMIMIEDTNLFTCTHIIFYDIRVDVSITFPLKKWKGKKTRDLVYHDPSPITKTHTKAPLYQPFHSCIYCVLTNPIKTSRLEDDALAREREKKSIEIYQSIYIHTYIYMYWKNDEKCREGIGSRNDRVMIIDKEYYFQYYEEDFRMDLLFFDL